MTITEQTTVGEIAAAIPSSVRVFERHGVDFCCGGKRPLATVCGERGLSLAQLTTEIEAAAASAGAGESAGDWSAAPLDELVDHIVRTYHEPLREELPRLERMARKVRRVHGSKAAFLAHLDEVVGALSADLTEHMRKEELILFPAIRRVSAGGRADRWIEGPITVMEQEHDAAGALLEELRRLTSNYTAPDWACQTFRSLYHGLEELEASMHVHVHLENNVLFPRAVAAAS